MTTPGQDFFKTFFEVENTIGFLKPIPSRTVDPNAPQDTRVEKRWTTIRSALEPYMEYEFKGNKYYENKVEMGTYSARGGRLSVRFNGGGTVSCDYDIKNGQLVLGRGCGALPTVFEPVLR